MADHILVRGNPLEPSDYDLIVQTDTLDVGKPVPPGWSVTSGNMHESEIVRVAMRYEITGVWLSDEED